MNEQQCGYTPESCDTSTSTCFLGNLLQGQASVGGMTTPDLQTQKGGGKYFQKPIWESFAERTKACAKKQGCLYAQSGDLEEYVDLITGIKSREGTLPNIEAEFCL